MKINQISGNFAITLLIVLMLACTEVVGQSIPPMPNPPRLVNDFAEILSPKEKNALENKLVRFNDTTSNQITVVIINSLNGYTPSQFAFEIGHIWKVGQKEFDNGIVLLVKPKTNRSKGDVSIAIGYGLEPAIPDAITKRIIENEMIPYFSQDDYYGGINNATTVLMKLASGEISADGYGKQQGASGIFSFLPFVIIFIIIILIRGSRGRSQGIGRSNNSLLTALMLGSMMGGGSHSGSWGNFSGGSSGFGGGGFGGFGGGGFGGGGASGSW